MIGLSKRYAGTAESREYIAKPIGVDAEEYEGGDLENKDKDPEANMIYGLAEYAGKKTISATNLTSI